VSSNAASGLAWRNIGTSPPAVGIEMVLDNDSPALKMLSRALGNKTEFTVEEWLSFGPIDVRMGHYIKAGENFFVPTEASDRDRPATWMPAFLEVEVPDTDDEETEKKISISEFYDGTRRIGWNGKEVKYVSISLEAKDLAEWQQPAEGVTRKHYEKYDNLRHNFNHIAQEACGSEVMMTDLAGKFVFMNNQAIYRESSIRGSLIGVAIAFLVLLMCTGSILLAVCATTSILCTLMSGDLLSPALLVYVAASVPAFSLPVRALSAVDRAC
jgi:hypothetical protein